MDKQKHKFYMAQILTLIFKDNCKLKFKDGNIREGICGIAE